MPNRYLRAVKRGLRDYRWLLYYLQQNLTLEARYRDQVAAVAARVLPRTRPFRSTAEARAIAEQLREYGIAFMPELLSASEVGDIVQYLLAKPCYDPNHPEQTGFQDP